MRTQSRSRMRRGSAKEGVRTQASKEGICVEGILAVCVSTQVG